MTPRGFEPDVVQEQLGLIVGLLEDLAALGDVTVQRLAEEMTTRHTVERILTQLVGLAVSVNSHVAATLLGRAPSTHRESFALAAKAGLIPDELAAELAPSAGLRNVLIHEYAAIDAERVVSAIPPATRGFRAYVACVARFLAERG